MIHRYGFVLLIAFLFAPLAQAKQAVTFSEHIAPIRRQASGIRNPQAVQEVVVTIGQE